MAIRDLGGRVRSEQTKDEVLRLLRTEFANLSDEEKQAVMLCLKELDDPAFNDMEANGEVAPTRIYDVLTEAEYIRKPVDIETFVRDPYYLGKTCDVLYPKLLDDMKELFGGHYRETILSGSIGWGKCLDSLTELYNTKTGRRELISDVSDLGVASMVDGGGIEPRDASCFKSGRKRCVRVALADGKSIVASNDHRIFTARGWVGASKLGCDDLVATPRKLPDPDSTTDVADSVVKLVAYLLADGGCTGPTTFTNACEDVLVEFCELVNELGDSSQYDKWHRHIETGVAIVDDGNSGMALTLRASGVRHLVTRYGCDKKSIDKRIPAEFYGLPRNQVALFLNRFWACDGSFSVASPRKVEIGLGSEGLVDDLMFLLLRLGIQSRKYYKKKSCTYKGEKKWFDSWCLTVTDRDGIISFLDAVGPVVGKVDKCMALRAACEAVKSNPNCDVVPVGNAELLEIRSELGSRGGGLSARFGCPEGQLFSRQRFEKLCSEYEYVGKYSWLAGSDIYWSKIKEVVDVGDRDVYDLTVPGTENFVANNIVVHNSFFASIAACRIIYELSCMRDPHKSFGIGKGTDITMVVLSVKEDLAIKVAFENIANKIKESDYFKENFPFKPMKKEIIFPSKIQIAARASTDSAALGLNVFAAWIDESNFMQPMKKKGGIESRVGNMDRAQFLYDQLIRRMKSRFQRHGKLPGMMIVVSSKQTRDDFTAKRIKDSKDDPTVFVRDYATWHVKPDGIYSKETFYVLVGNDLVPSKVLTPEEIDVTRDKLQDGMLIIDVPIDFKNDFTSNIEDSIRDIAGVETVSVSPFIQQRDLIIPCIDVNRQHPFTVEEWVPTEHGKFVWSRLARQVEVRDGASISREWQPLFHQGAARHIHIDPSLNSDATGFAVGCVTGYKTVVRRDEETREQYTERAPEIWVDFMLRIKPPIGGEIDHGLVRSLVYQMQAKGFSISLITMDQFNCLVAGTMVPTARGILPIEQVVVGDIVQSRIGPRPVENTWNYGERETIKIVTQDGDVLEGTPNHRIEIQVGWTKEHQNEYGWTRDPVWEWKTLSELSVGDVVHMADQPVSLDPPDVELSGCKEDFGWTSPRGLIGNWTLPSKMTPELAEFLGLLWGDGDVSDKLIRLTFHVDDTEDVQAKFIGLFGECPAVEVSRLTDKCASVRFGSTWVCRWMAHNGLVKPTIPDAVMRSSKAVKSAFLRGLFSADGAVSKIDGEISLGTSVRCLAEQVRLILRADFGIESCLVTTEKKYKSQQAMPGWHGGLHYVVSVRGPRRRFQERVGFCYRGKSEMLARHVEVNGRRKFSKIVDIEHGFGEVFDIQVADDPSYIANGFVSHNSASSLQTFATKGITAERLSVDKPMDAYDILKTAIYENRLSFYGYNPLLEELRWIQKDNIRNKVDHPQGKSKDLADALAGIVFSLTTMYHGPPMGVYKGISQFNDPVAEEQREIVEEDFPLLPFLQG
jgi:intein/homing endonuclease